MVDADEYEHVRLHVYARGQQASTMSREVECVVVCHIVSHSHCVCWFG